jgi:hypothetical protein
MFHARFGIDDNEPVLAFELLHALREQIVRETVTPAALRPAHRNQVEPAGFDQRLPEPVHHVFVPVHPRGDAPGERFLPHAAEGLVHGNTERLVQVRIGIRIYGKDRGFTRFNQ